MTVNKDMITYELLLINQGKYKCPELRDMNTL